MTLAIIPARGGSKRIKNKNIKLFHGKPIIARSIEAAKNSGCFDEIIVSTDSEDIKNIALEFGAEVPFMRPAELADDFTGTIPVIAHAIEQMKNQGQVAKQVCCIYPTAPFVLGEDLEKGLKVLKETNADFVLPATNYAFPIQRAIKLSPTGTAEMLYPENFNTRSQDLQEAYHDAGQFYWGKTEAWLNEQTFYTPSTKVIILPRERVQDIDTIEDWGVAEMLFKSFLNEPHCK